jgi:uncharacterized protein (DUF58 family)
VKLIFRVLYCLYRTYVRVRYWAGRRFTPAGLAVFCTMILAGLMGPDTDNNVIYQAFALTLALVAISISTGIWFTGKFAVARALPRFGTVGVPLAYSVRVSNQGRRSQKGLVYLERLADPRPSFSEWLAVQVAENRRLRSFRFSQHRRTDPFKPAVINEVCVPPVPPGQEAEVQVEFIPRRRGLLHFAGCTLGRPDVLGLFRGLKRLPLRQSALILPKRYPLPSIALPGRHKHQDGGVALASQVGQSEEFISLRDYRHGDPLRHIHWRSWARAGKPVVREFEDEFFVRHALVLDTFGKYRHSEAFEEAVSVAASFACTIRSQESLLDLLFVGVQSYCFTAGRGLAHADQMLEILASVQPCDDKPFSSLETLVLRQIGIVSGCVCVLLHWDKQRREFVRKLRALSLPVLVLVVVEREDPIDLDPGPMRDMPANFLVLRSGHIEPGLARLQI